MGYFLIIMLALMHFIADFTPISNKWMLSAKAVGKPILPILAHGAVHAGLMLIPLCIVLWGNPIAIFGLTMLQLFTHTMIDTFKGILTRVYPSTAEGGKYFWMVFGADQFLHIVVLVAMGFIATNSI